ncbi:UNVERIFIED_CONTAM: hypothetical protein Sangu_2551300 [Sesamum angustifolium]|uniref:Uncharacterized protein n=1 Tax=Sesamum angustifolium TaxID=2727405 RepID=A0AAW2JA17_9LAMI
MRPERFSKHQLCRYVRRKVMLGMKCASRSMDFTRKTMKGLQEEGRISTVLLRNISYR